MKSIQTAVIVFLLAGYIQCQSLNDLESDLNKAKDSINQAKDTLEKGLGLDGIPDIPDFNSTNIPKPEDVEKVLKEKCQKNGAPDAVDQMKESQESAIACVDQYINMIQVQEELDEAKKTGSMDEVFAKYCKKWPDIHSCFDNATAIARQCLDKREDAALNKTLDILSELQEFMCFKDGDRLAMFVAENGTECIKERRVGIQECLNKTVGSRIPDTSDLSVTNLPVLLFTEEDCQDFETLRECVNKELEKCKNSTPANIVDALFKFLKKHLPCTEALKGGKAIDAPSSSTLSSAVSVVLLIGSFLYVKHF